MIGRPLAGGTLQGLFAPNITNNPHKGIGGWSKDELVQYLQTGTNKWTLAFGPMAEAVTHSTSRITDEDISRTTGRANQRRNLIRWPLMTIE